MDNNCNNIRNNLLPWPWIISRNRLIASAHVLTEGPKKNLDAKGALALEHYLPSLTLTATGDLAGTGSVLWNGKAQGAVDSRESRSYEVPDSCDGNRRSAGRSCRRTTRAT